MGKNELGQVFDMAGRSYLFFPGFGQSHFKYKSAIIIISNFLFRKTNESSQKALSETTVANKLSFSAAFGEYISTANKYRP